jgi:hypothetical protein
MSERQTVLAAGRWLLCAALYGAAATAMAAVDVAGLWDYGKPELSEQRFRQALKGARGDDALILQTQIARSFGLRRQFEEAARILAGIEGQVDAAGPEARARYFLEHGRTLVSATHRPEEISVQARDQARQDFTRAAQIAREARLDDLAIDALHMLPFVDTDGPSQLKWNRQALDIAHASTQPRARRWETLLRNNTAYTLHQMGRLQEALELFKANVAPTEREGDVEKTRIAHWMVAWTLRSLARFEEALTIQLRLERENDADRTPDPYVFEELEHLCQAKDDAARAAHYAARLQQARQAGAK